MAHYAELDANNIVTQVFVGRDDAVEGIDDWETYYARPGIIVRKTSYNTVGGVHLLGGTPFRKNYAGIGYTYDESRDAFIPPKPEGNFILNEETCLWEEVVNDN